MSRPRYALSLFALLAMAGPVCAQPSLTPESGLLILTNGFMLAGQVTRAGDFYIVTQGEGSEQRLPVEQVEAFCGSLEEAYEFKQRHLAGRGTKPHLDLAEWCLGQNLPLQCSQQLTEAARLDPQDQRLAELERRLKLAVEATPPPATLPQAIASNVSAEELDKAARALPKGSVEKFAAIVQPILLNRCGANQCHGPNTKAEFRLLRPPAGQQASRRFTQRNLYATLAQLDRANPAASPLLTMPQQRHGSSLTAVFDKHSQQQLAQLEAWVALTTGVSASASAGASAAGPAASSSPAPATITPTAATLSQPGAAAPAGGSEEKAAQPSVRAMRPALEGANGAAAPGAGPARFAPRDRYDPEIFNRQYHK